VKELRLKDCAIRIGAGLIDEAGADVAGRVGAGRALVLTDTNCRSIAARAAKSLKDAGFAEKIRTIEAGEQSKTLETVHGIYEEMLAHRMERGSPLVAVGGGVVGDIGGLAASTFLRGVPLVQVPTSLLAQVDASIGGKTGVDFGGYKNIVGTFFQPAAVLIDPSALASLPEREFRTGMALRRDQGGSRGEGRARVRPARDP
jgi:3-dehydroquinate synthase